MRLFKNPQISNGTGWLPRAGSYLYGNGGARDRSWLVRDGWDLEQHVDWFLPTTSLPFAIDAGGNLFLLDRATDRVWFMPMDEWEHEEIVA